jgi:membrane protease YdiL (CAAX protease family)
MAVDVRTSPQVELRTSHRSILVGLCLVGGIAPLAARALPSVTVQVAYGLAVAVVLLAITAAVRRWSTMAGLWVLPFAFFIFALVQILNNSLPSFVQNEVLHESPVTGNPLASSILGTVVVQLLEAAIAIVPIVVLTRAAGLGGSIYARVGRVGRWHVAAALIFLAVFLVIGILPSHRYIPIHGTLDLGRYLALSPALLVMVLSNGFEEELLFRALFLERYTALFGAGLANVVQALIFAFAHAGVTYTPSALLFIVVSVFPLGLVAGYVMRKSDGVVAPALLHAALDIPIYLAFLTYVS